MTRTSARTSTHIPTRIHLHSSRLIRILSDLALADAVDPGMAFAEKLGQWVDYSDAISLSAALTASATSTTSPPAMPSEAQMNARLDAADAFARVRETLVASITKSAQSNLSGKRAELPAAEPGMSDVAMSYEPYRRRYVALQRDMEAAIRPLRAQMRDVLTKASPALKALAALDAALDGILCEREGQLLATVPVLLNKRFTQLLKAHQQALPVATQADSPALWLRPGGWLARFGHEFQTVLLAELDVRLQPTQGLMEALNNETTKMKPQQQDDLPQDE